MSAVVETGAASGNLPLGIILASGLAIAGAAIVHTGATSLLERVKAERSRSEPGARRSGAGMAAWAGVLVKTAAWLGALWLLTEWVPLLMRWRDFALIALDMTFTFPLLTIEGRAYSVVDLLELPLWIAIAWFTIRALGGLLAARVARVTGADAGALEPAFRLLRYVASFGVVVLFIQAWGFDLSSFAFFASIVGVGLGFGLQHVVNNFVSGVLVGLERHIKPGDFVQVGDWTGTVAHVGARSTEIRTLDRVSILVPNSRFLDTEVVNWSHGDPVYRLRVPVGVAYGSDVAKARAALLEAASGHPSVLAEPRARVEFGGFGTSSLDFELHVWAKDPRIQRRLASDLNYRIEASLRRAGLQIPFPQRDVHLHAPRLERLAEAWEQTLHGGEALANAEPSAIGPIAPASVTHGEPIADESVTVDAWTEADLVRLVERMCGPSGVGIADRRHLLSVYPRSFIGRDAVSWLVAHEGLTRSEAVVLGRRLVAHGYVSHVLGAHDFADRHLFYRFAADQHEDVAPHSVEAATPHGRQ